MSKYTLGDIFEGKFEITQPFGVHPENYQQFGLNAHEGVDWATTEGTPIKAPFDGIVVRDVDVARDGYGLYLVVWDPIQKCACWYAHLRNNVVAEGQHVFKGEVLGYTGNTGNSTGAHLHFGFVETDADGMRINQDNGYKGFLNPLDENLIEWKLTEAPEPAPEPLPDNTQQVRVTSDKGLFGRTNNTTQEANIITTFTKGTILDVKGASIGESIKGNNKWYMVKNGEAECYVWSGGVELIKIEKPKEEKPKPVVEDKDKIIKDLQKENKKLTDTIQKLNDLTKAFVQVTAPVKEETNITPVTPGVFNDLLKLLHLA